MMTSPDHPELSQLCDAVRENGSESWPAESLRRCGESGFFRWFAPLELGGFGWSASAIARGYLQLSASDLTTTFILTQRVAALRRIIGCENEQLLSSMIEPMLSGKISMTVGISHLTTSRQHLKQPPVIATRTDSGFSINGSVPWVTGGAEADYILMGASLMEGDIDTGQQILFLADTSRPEVVVQKTFPLLALSSSHTGAVRCDNLSVQPEQVVAGPKENVLATNGGGAGGLQTSILALGLAGAAIDFIERESKSRNDVAASQEAFRSQWERLQQELFDAAEGSDRVTPAEIRAQANSLALRVTQAALVVAKGAGFVEGHPVGRWCREAMFFLVWSCPQSVAAANLAEFAACE